MYFGETDDGAHIDAGSTLTCDGPVWVIMEHADHNGEINLWPARMHLPALSPSPELTVDRFEPRYSQDQQWVSTPTLLRRTTSTRGRDSISEPRRPRQLERRRASSSRATVERHGCAMTAVHGSLPRSTKGAQPRRSETGSRPSPLTEPISTHTVNRAMAHRESITICRRPRVVCRRPPVVRPLFGVAR